jgi:hypothetical protein
VIRIAITADLDLRVANQSRLGADRGFEFDEPVIQGATRRLAEPRAAGGCLSARGLRVSSSVCGPNGARLNVIWLSHPPQQSSKKRRWREVIIRLAERGPHARIV